MSVAFQGRITVTGLLDRERGDMYTLTVVADDGGPKKDSTVVCFFLDYFSSLLFMYNILFITVYYVVYSVVENLMAFLFCSLHLSLEVQKVRHAVVFQNIKGNMKSIHLLYLFILGFVYFHSSQR